MARVEVFVAHMSVLVIIALSITVYVLEIVNSLTRAEAGQSSHSAARWPVSFFIMLMRVLCTDW